MKRLIPFILLALCATAFAWNSNGWYTPPGSSGMDSAWIAAYVAAHGGGYSDTANAHNARQADSFHVYYYANVHGDSMWAYYIGAHGGHVVVFGDSTVLSSHTYFGAKVPDSLLATRYFVTNGLAAKLDTNGTAAGAKLLEGKDTTALWNAKTLQGKDTTAILQRIRDSIAAHPGGGNATTLQTLDTTAIKSRSLAVGGKAANATKADSALVSASTYALPDSNNTAPTVISATRFRGALIGNVTGNASGSSGSCTGNAATATTAGANTGLWKTWDTTTVANLARSNIFTGPTQTISAAVPTRKLVQTNDTTYEQIGADDTVREYTNVPREFTGKWRQMNGTTNLVGTAGADTTRVLTVTSGQNIGTPTHYGAGLSDITVQGSYAGHLTKDTFFVKCYFAGDRKSVV